MAVQQHRLASQMAVAATELAVPQAAVHRVQNQPAVLRRSVQFRPVQCAKRPAASKLRAVQKAVAAAAIVVVETIATMPSPAKSLPS